MKRVNKRLVVRREQIRVLTDLRRVTGGFFTGTCFEQAGDPEPGPTATTTDPVATVSRLCQTGDTAF